jgi:thiol-disulfide isomerase/thioredoxin
VTDTPDSTDASAPDRPVAVATESTLDERAASTHLALVEFYTAGCSICGALEPVLGNVARATDALVVTVNPRDDPALIDEYDVRKAPTLVLFEGREPVARRDDGFVGTEELVRWIESRGREEGLDSDADTRRGGETA